MVYKALPVHFEPIANYNLMLSKLISSVFPATLPSTSTSSTMTAASKDFIDADIAQLIKDLSDEEKMALLSAPNWWNTNKIDRLGVPAVKMSEYVCSCVSLSCNVVVSDDVAQWTERCTRRQSFPVISSSMYTCA